MSVVSQVRGAVQRVSPRTILWIGFAVFLLYAFPGYMSNDSVDQLLDARGGAFSDAHPPVMAEEWRLLDQIITGPILMLLVQGSLFLVGLYGILRHVMAARAAAVSAVAVMLFPPVLTTMAVIWKDSQMAAFLLAGTALLLGPRLPRRVLGLVLLSLGCAFRHNAFAAEVPLVGLLFVWRPGLRWWQRYAISAVASLAVFAGALGISSALTVHHVAVVDSVALTDIVGVLNYSRDRGDEELREVLRGVPVRDLTGIQARARQLFSPRSAMPLFYGERPFYVMPKPEEHEAIARAWRTLIGGDLRSYLTYRGTAFLELLGLSESDLWLPVWAQFLGYQELRPYIHHNAGASGFQQLVAPGLLWTAFDITMFRPYLYAAIALLLLVWCCRDALSFGLIASGLLYELSYFPADNTVDFRYSHWMITCTVIAVVVMFARRWRAGQRDRGVALAPVPAEAPAGTVTR